MRKAASITVLAVLFLGFTGSAAADLKCEIDTLSQKSGTGSECKISDKQDITGESFTAENVDIIIQQGGRIYTNHKTPSNNPVAAINLKGGGDFKVKAGGAVHANINISAEDIIIEQGGVIDASGLGWQSAADYTSSCKFGTFDTYCLGGGPAGGVSGGSNSNKGAGGGGHAGKGGSFETSSTHFSGGGYGSVNSDTYGDKKKPFSFGSGAGAQKDTSLLSDADGKGGIAVEASDLADNEGDEAVYQMAQPGVPGDGQDDPDQDPLDSDQWISTDAEYRKNNPNNIRMGSGGGKLKLTASNKIVADGTVISNGLDGFGSPGSSGYSPGGGAGGSVWITAGGIFSKGKIYAQGGDMMEKRVAQNIYSGGGGGGRVYVAYSIKGDNWDWNLSAERGYGHVDVEDSNNGNYAKDETSTGGTVFTRIAFSANKNTSIVNPTEPIKINGTASSNATIKINVTKVGEAKPDPGDGYYEKTVNALDINEISNLGNYTMTVTSTISESSITEKFNISIRKIQVQQDSDYILKPEEQFTVNSVLDKVKEDGTGGIQKIDYDNQTVNFDLFSANTNIESSTKTTNSSGGFSLSDSIPSTKGKKYYETTTENSKGIKGFDRKNLSWMNINDTIVDPGQYIQINGTAHNTVSFEIKRPNGSFLDKGSIDPNANGYFEVSKQALNRSIIDSEEDLGNYTLRVQTELNGQTRTETWEISHREIEINNNPDFFLKPDENLDFSDFAHLIKEDGTGESERVEYASQGISFNYFNQSNNLNSTAVTTNSTGGYSIFHDLQPTPGLKRFTLETENQNGIDDTIDDNDIYNINNRSLAWAGINDSIVDPGQQIQINGSAHNDVTVELEKPDGSYIERGTFTPGSRGFFEEDIQVLTRSILQDYQDLGNYTLRLNTTLNGETRTEKFNLSYRELEFYHDTDYLRRPGEQFTISGSANLTKEDGAGESETVPFANEDFEFLYFNGGNMLKDSTEPTDGAGEFSVTDTMVSSKGKKYYVIEDINENGITDLRSDNDLRNSERKNLGLVSLNDYIVNSGEEIKVNGTAYNNVEITFNGTEVTGSPVTPDSTTGFFNNTFEVPNIPETSGLGNQTLRVNTTLNGKERSEAFDVSLRGIRFDLTNTYPRSLNPGENFTVSGNATKYVADESGGSKPVDYKDETITIQYRDQNGEIQTKTTDTDTNGNFQIQDFESPPNAGDRTIEISTVNSEGITQERTETVKTQIRVENGTATSPHKRLFKDSNLDTSNFVNPEQDLKLQVDTRKSLDFVENVYANVTMPDETEKQVKLTAQNVLGSEFRLSQDWNDGNTNHLTHRNLKKNITSGKLRIGYQKQPEDDLLLEMPFEAENTGNLEDLSGHSNQISGGTNADTSGIFSTSGARFDGTNSLTLEDSRSLNLTSNFTISTWIKPQDTSSGTIYERINSGGDRFNPSLSLSGGDVGFETRAGSNSKDSISGPIESDKWSHVVGRYNGTHISIYINGEREAVEIADTGITGFEPANIVIGDTGDPLENDPYSGSIDNLRIFNSSLNEQRIKRLSKTKGSFETPPINTDRQVRDILKLLNFNGSLNNQEIRIQAFSDSNKSSSGYEEASEEIYLSNGTEIRSVSGFGNFSDRFKLNISLQTENVSESPILSRIDFKARKDDKITWSSSRNIENFFNGLYGEYNVSYTAEDFSENKEDSIENTSFSVRDIEIEPDNKKKADPGEQIEITGNATVVKGDGTGNKISEDFQGDLNILFGDTVQGQNQIDESLEFTELSGGKTRKVPVNGTESPRNAEITFFGKYEGIDETRSWNNASDWDQFNERRGMTHSNKIDSDLDNTSLNLGYSSKEVLGNSLKYYYSMDDDSYPLNDSEGSEALDQTNQPALNAKGILNTDAVKFNGTNGFTTNDFLGSADEYTLNVWIKPESIPDTSEDRQTIFSVDNNLKVELTENARIKAEATVGGTSYTAQTSSNSIQQGSWQMITVRQTSSLIAISKGAGSVDQSSSIGQAPDFSGETAYLGREASGNGFKGLIDEVRVYSSDSVSNTDLRQLVGDLEVDSGIFQQYIETETKSFSEQVKPGSLVLEADVETNGQRASVEVTDGSSTTERIRLENDQLRYQIPDQALSENKDYGLRIEMDSNITHAPKINELKLIRRFATENPEVDIDGDGSPEAEYTQSRILPDESQTVTLNNLTKGVNTASFDTQNGEFDARINYTEVLRNNTESAVNVNSSGEFSTNLTVPQKSGSSEITYYTTNDDGIQGLNATTLNSSLKFTSENISDLTNGDKVVDPKDKIQLNATIAPTSNPVDTMWVEIETQQGPNISRELNNETYSGGVWNFTENISNDINGIYDGEGKYTVKLNVNDTSGLEELSSPQLSFNVTNGTVSAEKTEETVGLGREFNLSGVVRQNLTSERQNATVNITFEEIGFSKTLSTDDSGFYEQRIVAPDLIGSFPIRVESVDEDGITARNTTYIDVEDSTSLNTEILQDPVQIIGLTFDNNKIVDVPIEINNTGDTDIRDLEVFGTDLPDASENPDLRTDSGATDWKSINNTYNISSGATRDVVATINASKASESGVYPINISTKFNTTGGIIKKTKDEVKLSVISESIANIEGKPEAELEDGYSGNFIKPDDFANANLTNVGTSRADDLVWKISNPRFKEWINNTQPPKDDPESLGPGDKKDIARIIGDIPEGTPPGEYKSELVPDGDADEFQSSNLTVNVKDSPKWNISISSNKSDLSAPEDLTEATLQNPLQLGTLEFGSTGNLTTFELINTGNRNLTFETFTRIGSGREGDSAQVFYQNFSNYQKGEYGEETFKSNIKPANNYKYDIESPQFKLGYQTKFNEPGQGIYKANITIKCTAQGEGNQCNPQEIEIPMNGTIKTTPPDVLSFETPEVIGTGSTVPVSGELQDSQGVDKVELKKTRYLESGDVTSTKTISFDSVVTPTTYSADVTFDKPASEDTGTDKFGLQIIATDVNGKEGYSVEKNVTVKDRGSVNFQLDDEELVLKGVNAQSGDEVYMTGNVTNGNVTLEDVEISAEVSGTGLVGDTSQLDVVSVNGSDGTGLSLGDLSPGETESFNFTLDSVPDIDPSAVFYPTISISRMHPDGFDETGKTLVEQKDNGGKAPSVAVEGFRELGIDATSGIEIDHNSTETGYLNLSSEGNEDVQNLQFSCLDCPSGISITGFSNQGLTLQPGEEETVKYNLSAEEGRPPGSANFDIEITSDELKRYVNDTGVLVREDRSVKIKPNKTVEAVPIDQGEANLTEFTAVNTGNVPLEPLIIGPPASDLIYVGEDIAPGSDLELNLPKGGSKDFQLKADTDKLSIKKYTEPEINPNLNNDLDNATVVNLTLFAQDIGFEFEEELNKTEGVVAGDKIRAEFNLTQEESPVTPEDGADLKLVAEGVEKDIGESYNSSSKTWTSVFEAPDIEDGQVNDFRFEARSDSYNSFVSLSRDVEYADVTPPKFETVEADSVVANKTVNISVELSDNSNIESGSVDAIIDKPSGSEIIGLNPKTGTGLSELETKRWKGNFSDTSELGSYEMRINATDNSTQNNVNQSGLKIFRVYQPLNIEGDAGEPTNDTEIVLKDRTGEVSDRIDPEEGSYDDEIKSGQYDTIEIQVDDDKYAQVNNLEASRLNQSPPKFESEIEEVGVDEKFIKGYAVESETLDEVPSGTTGFSYSDEINQIDYQGNLQVLKCEEYNVSDTSPSPCNSGYEPISKDRIGIDTESQTVGVEGLEGFSSYILVENTSSSEDTNLNFDLTGELGNLGDLGDLSSTLDEIASNTGGSAGGGANTGGGGTGSSGSSGGGGGALGELASQLNQSDEDDLAIGNSKISISVQPGQEKSTAVSIQNPKSEPVDIQLQSTDNIDDMLSYEENVSLTAGEFRTIRISVNASNKTRLKEYSGFIQIRGGETDRSIPVNIDIVGAENRLLDVSLEPTVDNFRPGKTARLKLSFSNQGFSRAVDAETTVEIVDITDDETVAKETHTYAVQTTLDKVVSLEIPKDTDLGTYEARASVEYSNIPGNRSATAVGQVEVQRPFWQQQTLGLANVYWLGIILALLAAGSGGGYWYYRKKKLEAKRSRFEEQVDNDAIPSEEGRTAFVGELSEIGTRAFIDLNDLMTHCLTAGATGAGKSVAAQVIVEEALEQGVNVIVLDPTGQWSGYLDENKDDEFFAFYEDFGMKEGDARSYEGNIRAVEADQDTIDITEVLRPEGDEGSIHVFSMHKLENAELEEYLSDTIQQIFDYNPEEKDELKSLIVYDEAHRVLEKFGGTGRGVKMLERGAREFRKWGTGMLMISQVIDDFPEEVRANIGTQIQMRTEYEGDLDRIERKYGNNITQGVTKADTGTGMLQNSSYNHGRPYFVDFRPVKHSPERLSDEELDKFEKYNRRVDEIEDMIQILEDQGEDVFEYESQLKLVKKNIRKRSFNLVDTYLNELEDDLNDALDL